MTDLDLPSRREQIVAAAFRLLGTTPLDRLTTRDIAAAVGVSQPALFRHFASRGAILLAVIDAARRDLGRIVADVVCDRHEPLAACQALARGLCAYVEEHPGLPRLLFADVALQEPEVRTALRGLVSMQRTLVAELVADAKVRGAVRADVEPQQAATLFVGMLQVLVLQARLDDAPRPLLAQLEGLLGLWLAAVSPVTDAATAPPTPAPAPPAPPEPEGQAVALDVRPSLARGVDPLGQILATLGGLPPTSVLVVTAPFRPRPLEALLTGRGHQVHAVPGDAGLWSLVVVVGGSPACMDLREREPPEPLQAVLTAAAGLAPGEVLIAWLPRHPYPLLPHLQARRHRFTVLDLVDGTAVLRLEGAGGEAQR